MKKSSLSILQLWTAELDRSAWATLNPTVGGSGGGFH